MPKRSSRRLALGLLAVLFPVVPQALGQSPILEEQLRAEPRAVLAEAARLSGDAHRGALIFFQAAQTCTRCHEVAGVGTAIGPDLTRPDQPRGYEDMIEAILEPSRSIRKGYETVAIATKNGQTYTGLLAEESAEVVVLRDPAGDGKLVRIPVSEIEERRNDRPSLMPTGLANLLPSRNQFLDLVQFLVEIANHGPERAIALRPDPALLMPPLPDYEGHIDHAGLIARLGPENLRRGEGIYRRVCVNCHGTRNRPGSLPTAMRFWSDRFKNGSDPYSLYRTLTHGTGQMTPQPWLVPRQKYDVIHYIREALVRKDNPDQYTPIDAAYLERLPKGSTFGPDPSESEPWRLMDYGSSLSLTIQLGEQPLNLAYKGIAMRLDPGAGGIARGHAWAVYDHDTLRFAGAWTGTGFIDWKGINFDGTHQVHPRALGTVHLSTTHGPGWADPATGSFEDRRLTGRDGRHYGPLPRSWAHFRGRYQHGPQVLLAYTVGRTDVIESPMLESDPANLDQAVFSRTLEVAPSTDNLKMRLGPGSLGVALIGDSHARLNIEDGQHVLEIPAHSGRRLLKVVLARGPRILDPESLRSVAPPQALAPLLRGGPPSYSSTVKTVPYPGSEEGPFAVDSLSVPFVNPWSCQFRPTGFDFLDADRAAVCTWDGDVWIVSGLEARSATLEWRRIASGLFQPLGLRIRDGQIYVGCRDQIVRLHDLNEDGEIDFYENFNSDHQVTEHFHEFAMDLQTDPAGNFYYAKAARHALPALVPQHGTLLRVSRDGLKTEILATGFRAPNGVCLNEDGTFFMTDQEGHWIPKNRINWVRPGHFYGNMFGFHDVVDTSDQAMEPPVCWITNSFDRSPSELVHVASASWGPLQGGLLNLSYGYGKVFAVLYETLDGVRQGGMVQLPIGPMPTGLIRGRFSPYDGHFYTCGMVSWATNQPLPGGFYRVRATGKPLHVPVGLHATTRGLEITFSNGLEASSAAEPGRFSVRAWDLQRTANYGSEHLHERSLPVVASRLGEDGRTVSLDVPQIAPTWGMEVRYDLRSEQGAPLSGVIHNTIHRLGPPRP